MRQTGRTTRIVQYVVEQLYNVGTCIATDHVVYEHEPNRQMLNDFEDKVRREVNFKSHGSKDVKTTDLDVNGVPFIKFEIIKINN